MRRIGIDFTSASRERAGIGRYARELIQALSRCDSSNQYVLFIPRDARDDLLKYNWPCNFSIRRAPLTERLLAALWHRARVPLPVEFFIGGVDHFYSPDFLLPPTRAQHTIVTVHDLSYVRVPECFPTPLLNYLNRAVPLSVKQADLILADATSTLRDLADVYSIPLEKMKVLYSGVDSRFNPYIVDIAKMRIRQLTHGKPYLLAVGTIQPRKNYIRLIEAFARLSSNSARVPADLQLVIAGGKGWMFDEVFQTVKRLNLQERVLFPDYILDEDLPALYALATLFVYPSLYEGFGLPIAEAMACGTPVVSSNASSLPEVGGEAVIYFDPYNVDALVDSLHRALTDTTLLEDLRRRGLTQAKLFSWDKAASELSTYF